MLGKQAGSRLASLDAYRGFLTLLLVAGGSGASLPERFSALAGYAQIAGGHGFRLAGPVQPAFAFVAGVALAFSLTRRRRPDESPGGAVGHAVWRCLVLALLGNLLVQFAAGPERPGLQWTDPLSQIGVGSLMCRIVLALRLRWQIAAAAVLLALRPVAVAAGFTLPAVLVTSAATTGMMLFGCWAGLFLLRPYPAPYKTKVLGAIGAAALAEGLALEPVIPLGGGTWTASLTFFALGWVLLVFTLLFWLMECRALRAWAFPFVVAGENAILAYSLACLLYKLWSANAPHAPADALRSLIVLPLVWCACFWLHRRGFRVRI
jgi:predicted acyltransferase